jgi:secernin
MCDTQVLVGADAVWFAKNSDREPGEPQPVVRHASVRGDTAASVRVTYLEIPQVPDRHAVILSKPAWCWGAEMGVNECGVAIGNEAIFSRHISTTPALLGMDLVRLGLERAASAREAVDVMKALLQEHGQGGPAGHRDKGFCYDNSYIVADAREAWLLETAGREWCEKRITTHGAISNRLTLGAFARRNDTRLMPFFAGAAQRRETSMRCLAESAGGSFARFARHLRMHHADNEDPSRGSNRDVCMHAAGFIRRHQTTGSMIAKLSAAGQQLVFTGTSAPCLSIFRPAGFDGPYSVITPAEHEQRAPLWHAQEAIHLRAIADRELREQVRVTRDDTEARIIALIENGPPSEAQLVQADRLAVAWQMVLLREALKRPVRLSRFWRRQRAEGIPV